ncbi:hypothetical protein ACFYQ5_35780 [Streptomyces sp. NPDC005794]|uniref:hypothetical protein n=1 Tax=Streptomyces sp. NPDC005794 TaxID=3364733 RepID=UPI0036A7D004
MTDKLVWFIILLLISAVVTVKIAQTNPVLALCFCALAAWGSSTLVGDVDEGPKRPALTILGEIAGVVGMVLALIELTR